MKGGQFLFEIIPVGFFIWKSRFDGYLDWIGGYFYNYGKVVAASLWSLLYMVVKGECFVGNDLILVCETPSSSKGGEEGALVSHFSSSIDYF